MSVDGRKMHRCKDAMQWKINNPKMQKCRSRSRSRIERKIEKRKKTAPDLPVGKRNINLLPPRQCRACRVTDLRSSNQ
jgi:hypothetical protein